MLSRFLYNGKYKDKLAMQKVIEGNLWKWWFCGEFLYDERNVELMNLLFFINNE